MGRIKKAAGPKHEATISPAISSFVNTAAALPISQLPNYLGSFPRQWPFPRGDLYHWIPLLNRFDSILERFNTEYGLHKGPQTIPFGRVLLAKGIAEESKAAITTGASEEALDELVFDKDGDRQLICSILVFSRILLENCGNRSLYNSSDRLGAILNTTNLPLLTITLQLAVRLAQRYHASRQRGANASQHLNNAMLTSHYNIDLEKVQKLANPFIRSLPIIPPTSEVSPSLAAISAGKGKEKVQTPQTIPVPSSDISSMARGELHHSNGSINQEHVADRADYHSLEDWGGVSLRYYQTPSATGDDKLSAGGAGIPTSPASPTPIRRSSGLSRPSRLSNSEDLADMSNTIPPPRSDDSAVGGIRTITIPHHVISSSSVEEIIRSKLPELPQECHYEFLNRVRVARALLTSSSSRQDIIGIRLLAITNLAYIYPETILQQKILHQDSDEPRRLQLAYQLTDLVYSSRNRGSVPRALQTLALGTLEALTRHKSRASDVCASLNINVNHGVLFYALRKAVSDLSTDSANETFEEDEWREALFSLLDALPASSPRTGETLIAAGLIDILLEILNLRTAKVERTYARILTFLNNIVYSVRDGFQALANSRGLDIISDLIAYEVATSLERAHSGEGLSQNEKNHFTDYQVPFFQQQTLRWLFKFVNHMMSHGNGNFDRLLRNLIDSSRLLGALRIVIANAKIFGSSVWSGAVNIMSSFIHNEPTSYAIIAEAGLSKALVDAILAKPAAESPISDQESNQLPSLQSLVGNEQVNAKIVEQHFTTERVEARVQKSEKNLLAQGILPATDAIVTIPQAFGAICLNNAGMELFMNSDALDKFFEIFESPDHVKSMSIEGDLARLLGSSFDELVRHHPRLKQPVMISVMLMIGRVGYLCRSRAAEKRIGAKLWIEGSRGELLDATELHLNNPQTSLSQSNLSNESTDQRDDDVVMTEAYQSTTPRTEMNKETFGSKPLDPSDYEDERHGPVTSTYIDVAMKFLAGFFENSTFCTAFIELGGVEFVLDFATLPSLPFDFNNHKASQEIARVINMLAEQKPHMVLPSLLKRAQTAVDNLEPFLDHTDGSAFFSQFTFPDQHGITLGKKPNYNINGTQLTKSMVYVHTLSNILCDVFAQPITNSRSSHTVFSQVNLADLYVTLIKSLGRLHRACVWEEVLLQKNIPDLWKEATRTRGYGMGSEEADEIFGFINRNDANEEVASVAADSAAQELSNETTNTTGSSLPTVKKDGKALLSKDEQTASFKNVRVLRYLLSQLPSSIVPFFQALGKALIAKRRPDVYTRQYAYMVAAAMSEASLGQLKFDGLTKASKKDRFAYWVVILTSLSQLIVEGSLDRPHPPCLTLVLQAFQDGKVLDTISLLLKEFLAEVKTSPDSTNLADVDDRAACLGSCYGGIKIILGLYTQIVTGKSITEAPQTATLASNERDRGAPHFFSPQQFLVELRIAVLPVVKSMWESEFMEKALGSIVKSLIEILKIVLEGTDEQGAFKSADKIPTRNKAPFKIYSVRSERVTALTEKGYDIDLAREALYRCVDVQNAAEDYCRAQKTFSRMSRCPIPRYDLEKPKTPSPVQTPQRQGSETTILDPEDAERLDDGARATAMPFTDLASEQTAQSEGIREDIGTELTPIPLSVSDVLVENAERNDGMSVSTDNSLDLTQIERTEQNLMSPSSRSNDTSLSSTPAKLTTVVTINDLDEERAVLRKTLIDRALDVLNVHDDVTFELADLIGAAASKAGDSTTFRREIGETLVSSLISFYMDGDFRSVGKKVAAYANLLALVIQDREFYDATLEELKTNFHLLLGFIKIFPDQTTEELSPWIGQILLVVEKVLTEDVQPSQIQWVQPSLEDSQPSNSVIEMDPPLIPTDEKIKLFDAVMEILLRIGKDESLALSVIRVLVILTRNRNIALSLGEKRHIQRLFVMVKQLAGITNERVQSSLMLLLRHIVEDEDMIRQIMRSEIIANFETKTNRTTDTTGYVRHMYHLVLRSPTIFVEVTNEEVEIPNYDATQRPQVLALKSDVRKSADPAAPSENEVDTSTDGPKPSDDQAKYEETFSNQDETRALIQKTKTSDVKAPVVEHPSGVIYYLLYELLSYKEVEDKESIPPNKEAEESSSTLPADSSLTNGSSAEIPSVSTASEDSSRKSEKPEFKIEQHPIYIYRCFILQCLAELLQCYNRTKIEFINFSRKADPKATTPSKPRSAVLNYLLNDLIPVGTLNHDESISFRKKSSTSNWAMSAIVSLCLRTNENGYEKKRGAVSEDDEQDLLFVRKFVLEHALKAYKDANTSEEPPDVKYTRLLCIADLFDRILQGKLIYSPVPHSEEAENGTQQTLAKLMFEKNFISVLTGSIADIDLNFPGSKRAIKHILRPLKQLTSTAVILSETSSISSTPGQTDDDEISTATSVTDMGDEREETPDLFRNSTLGMFEPGREEESSSESSGGDQEMYDDDFEDEGVEYRDEMERDEDEVISDEEIEGAGPIEGMPGDSGMDVEVLINQHDDDEEDDEDEDEEDDDDEPSDEEEDDSDEIDENHEDGVIDDEINGASENNSLAEGEDEEWQDEDEDSVPNLEAETLEHDLDHHHDDAVRDIVREFGGSEAALQRLEDRGFGTELDGYMEEVIRDEDEDDDEDAEEDDDDEIEDEDVMYHPGFEDEEPPIPDAWGWDIDDEDPVGLLHRGQHHHHPRRMQNPWTIFPTGPPGDRSISFLNYRSHRSSGPPPSSDDGVNPLLRRADRSLGFFNSSRSGQLALTDTNANVSDYWIHGMDHGPPHRGLSSSDSPVSFVNNILAAIGHGGSGFATMGGPHGSALHFHVTGGSRGIIPRELQAVLGLRQPAQELPRITREENNQPVTFTPAPTYQRWQEEARIIFGNAHAEKAQRVVNSLLRALVPPAIEREQKRLEDAVRQEKERVRQESERAKEEEAAKEAQRQQEQAEREAAAAAEAEAEAEAPSITEQLDEDNVQEAVGDEEAMEGVEHANGEGSSSTSRQGVEVPTSVEEPATASSQNAERVRTTIRGRELDITGMGVDLDYLDALPEDLREEVLMHQLALQRSQAAAAGEEPTDISREFLEALPPDIRDELLQQEAQDRRRREREEERRRRATANGGPTRGEDLDPATFLATLDPTLRQAVLSEQDEEVLAQLPQAIAAEARALGGNRMIGRFNNIPRLDRLDRARAIQRANRDSHHNMRKPQRRQIIQMLDKAGVATLLRLMFIPQQGSSKKSLDGILHDVSLNRQNRAETVSLLLSILQDGSTDINAVERSFNNLSLRAKPSAIQKTPQPLRRSLSGQISSPTSTEMTPLTVVQQCLSALNNLTQSNPHIPSFFLTEHEITTGLKGKSSRKGKSKEIKANKYALNALLTLLDRKLVMESSSCMEQLSNLLQSITHPLTMLLRKDREKVDELKDTEDPSDATDADPRPSSELESVPATSGDEGLNQAVQMQDIQVDHPESGSAESEHPSQVGERSTDITTGEANKVSEEDKVKKPRTLSPPVVPEENLRLVVNILAARECSAKTFRDTLSTMNNLSAIPEAKEVFGKGLVEQARNLSQSILSDLEELVPQIRHAESGTDIRSMALAKFSPSSSDQAKLLRILTALDYLFDLKRNGGKSNSVIDEKTSVIEGEGIKQDLLSTLCENSTFGLLWNKLSECLSVIRQGESTLSIATILLPLIEALMVVCKNTALKDTPLMKAIKEISVSSPPPESGMEGLFFRFTEDHRKILNDLVRHNPKLMSGTFSLLVKNPKVLEFDNKRNYFTRRLHSRTTEARQPQPPLQLSVRRDQVFLDSFKFLSFKSGDEIKYGKLSIRFHGEEGVDAGGVTREWFQVLSRQMFNPGYALFIPVASDRGTFHPNKLSKINEEHLMFFKFIGRIIGKALYEGRALDCHFSRAVYKRILGKSVSVKDMETLDLAYYNSLLWMLENDITDIISHTFSVETDDFGVTQIVDLIDNGRNIPVTEENKQEYVQLVTEHRLTGSVQAQLEQFLKGFHDIIPAELISIFNEQELELLISGLPDIDVDDWKNNTEYHNYNPSSPPIQWFWRAVRSFDKEERAKLLQFVTGTSKVPLNGFGQLEGMNGFSKFNIHRDYGDKERLPSSHTCFNQLDLPEYDSYETLRQRLYVAMTTGSEYFGFA